MDMKKDTKDEFKKVVSDDEASVIKGGAKKISSSVGKGGRNQPADAIEDGTNLTFTRE